MYRVWCDDGSKIWCLQIFDEWERAWLYADRFRKLYPDQTFSVIEDKV